MSDYPYWFEPQADFIASLIWVLDFPPIGETGGLYFPIGMVFYTRPVESLANPSNAAIDHIFVGMSNASLAFQY